MNALASCPDCGVSVAAGLVRCQKCGGTLAENEDRALDMSDELAPGTELGTYRIVKLLGEGGMGRVYLAEHMRLGRRVALKMLRQELAVNPVAVSRFFAEARAVNRLSHEHLVEITDFFEKPGGENYFIMELLKGEDLGKHLLRVGALPIARAVDISHQIASVLTAVHAAHIIHRDLKPDNIFLVDRPSRPDFVKILDFGVAKLSHMHEGIKLKTTSAGAVIGTPEYMSPEQAGGLPVDHRTDIYALGVIMYEIISGRLPFQAKSFGEMVIKHMTVTPKPLSNYGDIKEPIPAVLEELVNALLAKDPDQRPQTMSEVEDVLLGLLDYVAPVEARPRSGEMPVLKRPSKPGTPPTDPGTERSQRMSAAPPISGLAATVEITGREPTMEVVPGESGAIPSAALSGTSEPNATASKSGPIATASTSGWIPAAITSSKIPLVAASAQIAAASVASATAFAKRPPVKRLVGLGCAMAVAAVVTWLAMRGGNSGPAPVASSPVVPVAHTPPAPVPAPAARPAVAPPAPAPASVTQATPVAPPPSEASPATPVPPTSAPPPAVSTRKTSPQRPPQHQKPATVDRSGTMDVFGDN